MGLSKLILIMEETTMEKNLGNEFREVMTECKEIFMTEVVSGSMSGLDEKTVAENVKALLMVNRLMNLCCDLFEKQNKLMDKMDKEMDKYLEK